MEEESKAKEEKRVTATEKKTEGRVKEKIKTKKKTEKKEEKIRETKPETKPKKEKEFDPWSILRYPHLTEKSMKSVEIDNKLVFIVDRRATKDLIALAVEKEFNVTVVNVNTEITTKGLKKAYVKLSGQYSASDIATRLGMV